ncbi:MAG: response regulator [Hyphomicrobium sp.]
MSMTPPVSGHQDAVILVADDDPIFRSLIIANLKRLGGHIVEAADGAEAWRVTRSHTLSLAIVDYDMPGLDGIALIRCLRGHASTRHIPIVMCTARTELAAMQNAIEAGVSSFLNKPVAWGTFQQHINHLMRLSRSAVETNAMIDNLASLAAAKDAQVADLVRSLEAMLRPASVAADTQHAEAQADLRAAVARFTATYEALTSDQQALVRGLANEPVAAAARPL